MLHHAVFLDRDGTINYDPGYLKDPGQVQLCPGVAEGIKKLKDEFHFKIIVISNQAGIARGFMTHDDVSAVNQKINQLLSLHRTSIDAFYYCPYHPDYSSIDESSCRKPSPFLIQKAATEQNINLRKSYMIGDKDSDILSGINAGTKTILIKYTNSKVEINNLHNHEKKPNFIAANFFEACDFIFKDFSEEIL